MGTPLNYGRGSKRNMPDKRYDFDLPATKRPAAVAARVKPPSAELIERQIATDNARQFKSDAEAVLVNLTITATISRNELRKNLSAKGVKFDDAYLQRLLAHLTEKRRVIAVSKGDMWKRT